MRVSRKRDGAVEVRLEEVEAAVLTSVATDLLELLGEAAAVDDDPLVAMVGLPSGPVDRPEDPALARLLPDAYGDDEQASADFRRYTDGDLRAGKRAHAGALLASLAPFAEGGRLMLDRAGQDAWLGCLNDLRLVLGTRLDVDEDTELDAISADPRQQALQIYGWLGLVQESLLEAMSRG